MFAPQAAEDEKRLHANERATVRGKIKQHLRHDATKTSKSRIKRLRGLKQPQYRLTGRRHPDLLRCDRGGR